MLRKRGEKELACERLGRRQTFDYSLHEHGKSVVIAHRESHGSLTYANLAFLSRTRVSLYRGARRPCCASIVRGDLRTYRLSRSLKIHECVELLSLANYIVTRKGFGSHTVK